MEVFCFFYSRVFSLISILVVVNQYVCNFPLRMFNFYQILVKLFVENIAWACQQRISFSVIMEWFGHWENLRHYLGVFCVTW